MGRPSEEQLLGLRRRVPEMNVSFEPPPPPEWGLAETAPTEGSGAATRRWRLGPRDLIALAAVAAVVWLAVRSGDGLPFRSSEPPPPAAAGNVVRTTLAPDRLDLKRTATRPVARTPTTKKSNRQKDQKGQKASTGPGEKDDGPPTGGGGGGDDQTKPLLEATLPVLGTVTVDQPELPTVPDAGTPTLPTLPDTGDVLPGTPTVSLP
jgi:hypothetical protein